jgi:response regulator of citrate/malate metabolism
MILKVLVVDDDNLFVFMNSRILAAANISSDPIVANKGTDVLDYIISTQEEGFLYLIFLDINMPVMNGWELLDEINKYPFSNRVFAVMVTSSADARDMEKAVSYPNVIDFIEKPLKVQRCEQIKKLPDINEFF